MTAIQMRDAIAEAARRSIMQSKAMRALTTEEASLLAIAIAGNAAMVISADEETES